MDSIRSETSGKSSSSRVNPAKIKKRPTLIAKSLEVIRKMSIKETGVKNTTNKQANKRTKKAVNVMVKEESSCMQSAAYACTGKNINHSRCNCKPKQVTFNQIWRKRFPIRISPVKPNRIPTTTAIVMSALKINAKLNIFFNITQTVPAIFSGTKPINALNFRFIKETRIPIFISNVCNAIKTMKFEVKYKLSYV